MKTCTKCGHSQDLTCFPQEMKRGVLIHRSECLSCRQTRVKVKNHQKYLERRVVINQLKDVPCLDCGGSYLPCVMDFDHRDPSTKCSDVTRILAKGNWQKVLDEIAKCDIVCANCHRLRSWQPSQKTGRKRQILRDLKSTPCVDCGGVFHYSQMDFDHLGEKLAPVSRLTGVSLGDMLLEVGKCELVCANCHRIRTHCARPERTQPSASNMPTGSWQDSVGLMEDQSVAALFGVSRVEVYEYRKVHRIPSFRKNACDINWQSLVGTLPDRVIAGIGSVTRSAVGHYRRRLGVPDYNSIGARQ